MKIIMKLRILSIAFCAAFLTVSVFAQKTIKMTVKPIKSSTIQTVFQPGKSPIVSVRVQFLVGSVDDPQGKEGLASLTAAMVATGGTKTETYEQIVEKFYPMAADFNWQSDKEMTTFSGQTHIDNLPKYYEIIRQMMLAPGFREDDFNRLKDEAINFFKVNLRQSNDEELGKERLYNLLYAGHPYEHHSRGTVSSLEKITLQDVKDFYKNNFTQANTVIGLAGGFDANFSNTVLADFAGLPKGARKMRKIGEPALPDGIKIDIVQRETRATAFSIGLPIPVNRASGKDYAALALVASYFGQHRSSNSYLYGQLRELRGLNYGDYAYIEYFPRGMFQFEPDANLGRKFQIFQMWIRPVEPDNANFALRAAVYEYVKLASRGIDQQTFDETRDFLTKYVNILTQTKDAELGYALDSKFYGIGNYNEYLKAELAKLTLTDVNLAIKKYLPPNRMQIVAVTKDAESLRDAIIKNQPGQITYASPKPKEVTDEDKIISIFPLSVKPADVTITPVEKVFQ